MKANLVELARRNEALRSLYDTDFGFDAPLNPTKANALLFGELKRPYLWLACRATRNNLVGDDDLQRVFPGAHPPAG